MKFIIEIMIARICKTEKEKASKIDGKRKLLKII